MLSLDDPRWTELDTAYGSGETIAQWLERFLVDDPAAAQAAWDSFDAWGYICHQFTVYAASFAAVPHLVEYGGRLRLPESLRLRFDVLHLVGWIAIGYHMNDGLKCPDDLQADFRAAMEASRPLICEQLQYAEDEHDLRCMFEALAGVTGNSAFADEIHNLVNEAVCPHCGEIIEGFA
jgi:hypothetical protein